MSSIYELVEKARKTGKVEKGTNEVTKSIERGTAKLVVYAEDVEPKEIVQHLPLLCREKGIPCVTADSRQKLGIAAGITVPTASIAIINAGDAASRIAEFAEPLSEAKSEEAADAGEKTEKIEEKEEKPKRARKKKLE